MTGKIVKTFLVRLPMELKEWLEKESDRKARRALTSRIPHLALERTDSTRCRTARTTSEP
jgi:hypothetical protein